MGRASHLIQCMIGILAMHDAHLSGIDLNLLPALDALLRERHVTRAAQRVGLSQSAMSHALARLRELLGDPILVRSGRGMVPTERAEALEGPLRDALAALESALGAQDHHQRGRMGSHRVDVDVRITQHLVAPVRGEDRHELRRGDLPS